MSERWAAARRAAVTSAVVTAGAGALAAGLSAAAAAYLARRVVTPDRHKPDDVEIVSAGGGALTLVATEETTAPGRYGLWIDGGAAHVQLGEVLDHGIGAGSGRGRVTRAILGGDVDAVRPGPARWNQYFYAGTPDAVGLAYQDISIAAPVGQIPAWLVAPHDPGRDTGKRQDGGTWAVLVHGRGATREECLRALPVLHRIRLTSLVTSYRNDSEAPASPAGTYALGDTEWLDVEAAMLEALDRGARDVVLVGWSMGGAIALQLLARSWLADRVRAVVLDAPVVDWRAVLDHHARLNRVPKPLGRLGLALLGHPMARRLVGVDGPVDLRQLDWVTRAAELAVPVLLIHSDDDEYVPSSPSAALAAARPDLVTYVPSRGARHTKEWNVDPDGWERTVARFLLSLPEPPASAPAASRRS